ncbi:hypothetical protein FSOLCH5_003086 [Fusarium solani]|uniref:Uncharacterized protein n=1 Tax=Fusarium solani TaxID=169388 RepID=A0A9P9RAW0_FUSSL|nr:uncharacterized protein B0J15DRAFT_187562 [Fusarium solani]KAH7272796.1 hypothetical protein B0J15DRAFT_187562 [Fusarium solani]KAI8677233.1 hypothetical protein NCS56_00612900 [Fusarium sp. Ph1]KAJ3469235.1 hypothetical protein MRS44_003300 [Fusarium solani]KAJ4229917.1 hypothetical protein NW759_003283 [Fusarium solani]
MTFGRTRTSSSSEEQRGRNPEPVPIMDDKQRTNSYSSEASFPESAASSPPKSSHSWFKPAPQAVNVYTTCGRHTNQLLFGGPSLTELARSMLKKD